MDECKFVDSLHLTPQGKLNLFAESSLKSLQHEAEMNLESFQKSIIVLSDSVCKCKN